MRFGVCGNIELAACAAKTGYDFAETTVEGLLKPREDKPAFVAALETFKSAGIPCPVVNCLVPADLKITGPLASKEGLEKYIKTTFERAKEANVKVLVFGSGGARAIPDGFDRDAAWEQLVWFGKMMAPLAAEQGLILVVEPLNRTETNVLNTVAECARLVRQVDNPAFRLLVDGYHWMKDNDSPADIAKNGDILEHVHIATMPDRRAPGLEECDLAPFFKALKAAKYDGRISIEGKIPEPEKDLPNALNILKELAK